ncbi:hypothetical protein Tco_0377835 [Tanacetum coccineum]
MKADVDLEEDQEEDNEVIQPLIPQPIHTTPPNDDYVSPATPSILDELLEGFGDKIMNATMVDEEADSNPTRDIRELERLLAKDPHSYFMEIQVHSVDREMKSPSRGWTPDYLVNKDGVKLETQTKTSASWEAPHAYLLIKGMEFEVYSLETLTRLHLSTWATKWFKRLVAYAKCNRDSYIWDNEDVHDLGSVETKFSAIVFNDTLTSEATLSCEPMVSSLNNDEINFRISFDEFDDEDWTASIRRILGNGYGVSTSCTILGPRERNINEYWWRIYESGNLKVLES